MYIGTLGGCKQLDTLCLQTTNTASVRKHTHTPVHVVLCVYIRTCSVYLYCTCTHTHMRHAPTCTYMYVHTCVQCTVQCSASAPGVSVCTDDPSIAYIWPFAPTAAATIDPIRAKEPLFIYRANYTCSTNDLYVKYTCAHRYIYTHAHCTVHVLYTECCAAMEDFTSLQLTVHYTLQKL